MSSIKDNKDLVRVPLSEMHLVLKDYKPHPAYTASGYRFSRSAAGLKYNEHVLLHGMMQLVYVANSTGKIPIESIVGVFIDDTPVFALSLTQQHEWVMEPVGRTTFSTFTEERGILHELVNIEGDGKPLYCGSDKTPDQLLLFLLGSPEIAEHFPRRTNFNSRQSLFITPGDPLMLSKDDENFPFTVTDIVTPEVGTEYIIRADRLLLSLFIPLEGPLLLGAGIWAKGLTLDKFLPVLIQLYRITSNHSFLPYRMADISFSDIFNDEDYRKRVDAYITSVDEQTDVLTENIDASHNR